MESGEIVRAINKGNMPLTMTYASRDYVLHPDREAAVPFDTMVLYFGDPRAMAQIRSIKDSFGIVTWIPDRDTEVRRLRVKWGIQGGDSRDVLLSIPVEFYDFEGNRIETVVDDPRGDRINLQPQTVSEVDLLKQQIVVLQARQDQMEAANRPTPVDEEIAHSAADLPDTSLEEQAVAHFATQPHLSTPVSSTPSASDIPEDTSTSNFTGAESASASPMTDLTGNPVKLRYTPEELAAIREQA